MKNYMMIGRLKEKNEYIGYRILEIDSKKVLDLDNSEILHMLKNEDTSILNLEINDCNNIFCPHNIEKYGVVGESNAFVIISKQVINASLVDGTIFEISDTNGLVKKYYQSDAINLQDFYEFANVKVNISKSIIEYLPNSKIYLISAISEEERKLKVISFVKELMNTGIQVTYHETPYKNESPNKFALSALGRTGYIITNPGTESFNKTIVDKLKFNNVSLNSNCKYIQPTYGYTDSYCGWSTNSPEINKLPAYEFSIAPISFYGQDFLNGKKYSKDDYAYSIHVKFLQAYVYILKNNKIGRITLCKQN